MSTAVEFIVQDFESSLPAAIDANFDEVKSWLTESLSAYQNLAVSPETLADCKAARAKINKLSKAISDQRIAVKKRYLEPYNTFEAKAKELTAICDSVSGGLDSQIKEIEESQKAEKLNTIREYFNANVGEAADYLSFESVQNPKWTNVTVSIDTAFAEIDEAIKTCVADVATIRDMESPFQSSLLAVYRETHDIGAVVRKDAELKRIAEAEERRRLEREAAEAEERRKALEETVPEESYAEPPATESPVESARIVEAEEVQQYDFRIWATRSQVMSLAAFLKDRGIKYGKVK